MAHLTHFKKCDIKRVSNEYERDEKYKCSDNRIDATRTKYNYVMDTSVTSLSEALEKRLSEVPHQNKASLNVLSSWVVTCPQELKDDKQQRERFFALTYEFIKARYGNANVLQGYVHMDETTPHMHVSIVPATEVNTNKKSKGLRISSKKLFTKTELRDFQQELDALMEREYGTPGLILNGRTQGNYTVAELKERSRRENALDSRETALNALRGNLERKDKELSIEMQKVLKRANKASEREKELAERKKALDERETALQKREEILDKREKEQQRFITAGREALAQKVSKPVTNAVKRRRNVEIRGVDFSEYI